MAGRNYSDNYVSVKDRIAALKAHHPGKQSSIQTSASLIQHGERSYALIKAIVYFGEEAVGSGHSLVTDLDTEKGFEKGESSAIGRALAHAGYSAKNDEDTNSSDTVINQNDNDALDDLLGDSEPVATKAKVKAKTTTKLASVVKKTKAKVETPKEEVVVEEVVAKTTKPATSNFNSIMSKYDLRK